MMAPSMYFSTFFDTILSITAKHDRIHRFESKPRITQNCLGMANDNDNNSGTLKHLDDQQANQTITSGPRKMQNESSNGRLQLVM